MEICKWCNEHKKLIKAHIYPKYFYEQPGYMISSNERPERSPVGIYDSHILCGDCDSKIFGVLDQYAKNVLMDNKGVYFTIFSPQKASDHNGDIKIGLLDDENGRKNIIRFFISVLWRAHVSSRNEFARVDLGKFEKIARQAISNPNFDFSEVFAISIYYLKGLKQKANIMPDRVRIKGINFYILTMGNFKIYIKCDSQSYLKEIRPLVVCANTNLLFVEDELQNHIEHKILYDLAAKLGDYLSKNTKYESRIVEV